MTTLFNLLVLMGLCLSLTEREPVPPCSLNTFIRIDVSRVILKNGHLLLAKVALSGAHTVGACHVNRSGFERPCTDEKLKFDAWCDLEKPFVFLYTPKNQHGT